MQSLLVTPMQTSAENAVEESWQNWQKGEVLSMIGNSLYARAAYLADMIASIVILPFALIAVAFGSFQAMFLCSVDKANFLTQSNHMLVTKLHRLFASALGAVVSPGMAHYFERRNILPMATGLVVSGGLSYMVLRYQPEKANLLDRIKNFWSR